MLSRAFEAEVPASWVTGDEVYGQSGKLRRWLEAQEKPYVLAVSRSHPLMVALQCKRAQELLAEAPPEAWERVEVGAGCKGPRLYDWARARLPYESAPGWTQWLVLRRLGESAGGVGLLPGLRTSAGGAVGVGEGCWQPGGD